MADDTELNEPVSTEQEILDSLGEGDESSTSESTTDEAAGTAEASSAEASPADSEQGATRSDDANQTGQAGSPQDLKDAQGNVIARGGAERRLYERANNEKVRADKATRESDTLKDQLQAITNAGSVGTQYNLSPEEVTTGAQLIAAYKENPVGTIKYMLTQAQASGHNVDELVEGSMDAGAIKQIVDNALQPLLAEHQERTDTQNTNNEALEIYNTFSTQFPDAYPHEDSLAKLMQQDPGLSPDTAYYKLKSYYLERNLDCTKSLEALQQEQSVAGPRENTQQALPEGNVAINNVTDTSQVADVNTSFDDIIRGAMSDAGINQES